MEFREVIDARRSIRRFREDVSIPREELKKIIYAGMVAPNAGGKRPWEFFVADSREVLDSITEVHPAGKTLRTASAVIIVCGRKSLGAPMPEPFIYLDCAAAVTQMLLQATDLGYGACWTGAYPSPDKMQAIRNLLNLDDDYLPVASIVVGAADESPEQRGFWEEEKVHFL